ncbi:LemA family protein [Streptococcus sp. zg-JUN1979]|uniref:LemA family protein n=1 Tax=Streptococcus sp. zg-JUN1979 TaxID=3391450 RepID=UPI0039A700D3
MAKSLLKTVLSLIGLLIVSSFLWIIIFSITTPEESDTMVEPFRGAVLVGAVVTTSLVYLIVNTRQAVRLNEATEAAFSNISITKERNAKLLDKANRFLDKHLSLEKERLESFKDGVLVSEKETIIENSDSHDHHLLEKYAKKKEKRKQADQASKLNKRVETSKDFAQLLKDVPKSAMNQHVNRLFEEILKTEKELSDYQQYYNTLVEHYNAKLKEFPVNILKKSLKLQVKSYYILADEDDFSDELLGI